MVEVLTKCNLGGGQPNSTQFMPMPILRFECGIGINWHSYSAEGDIKTKSSDYKVLG